MSDAVPQNEPEEGIKPEPIPADAEEEVSLAPADFAEQWNRPLGFLAAIWGALLLLFWRDTADMVAIWWNSSTFNHCLLIVPILGWLVLQRKELLFQLKPEPWTPALLYGAVGAGGWLIGDAAGLAVARQLGLIMMLQGSVAAVLGANIARGLFFPLFYMFFLVPIGEEAVPILQTLTAKMCMILLGWTGIPAHIDGIFITTPTGYFRVAEACSGVKFLIAMVAYGVLVANLCFNQWPRRIAFLAACVVVPILANGLRAFGTIYIAHHSSNEFASSFDHVFYGWIFFGIVIGLVMAAGWPFFDRKADAPAFDPAELQAKVGRSTTLLRASIAILLIAAIPFGWSTYSATKSSPTPDRITLPQVEGWDIVPYAPTVHWTPRFVGGSHYLSGRYRNDAGQEADLFVVVYDRQSEGRELVGFGQGAIDPDGFWSWTANMPAPPNGKAERIKTQGAAREVVSFYRVNGVTSGSAPRIKLATLQARLLAGDQQAVAILVSAEQIGNQSPRPAIDAFVKSLGDIDKMADRFAGLR
ncbi:MAG: EpsI domain-containing exosortase [Sphingopyxis sp.]|nr:EpsI domain-containing exosortase [Sphingopyxis sp.]